MCDVLEDIIFDIDDLVRDALGRDHFKATANCENSDDPILSEQKMIGGFEAAQEELAFAIFSLVLANLTNTVRGIVGNQDFSH